MVVIFSTKDPFLTLYSVHKYCFLFFSQPYFVIFVTFRVNNYNGYPKQDYNSQNVEVLSRCKLKLTLVGEQTSPYVEASQYPWIPPMQHYLYYFSKQDVHLQ